MPKYVKNLDKTALFYYTYLVKCVDGESVNTITSRECIYGYAVL